MVVNHDARAAARTQDSPDFTNCTLGFGCVVQHTPRINNIEGGVLKWQVLSIGNADLRLETE
jgi:hypothetical protein